MEILSMAVTAIAVEDGATSGVGFLNTALTYYNLRATALTIEITPDNGAIPSNRSIADAS
ncbi:MAG: hypothetical protein HP492_17800 [Nitrospira sp.]|nr:hypothetical protein [Nitrospira sp.]